MTKGYKEFHKALYMHKEFGVQFEIGMIEKTPVTFTGEDNYANQQQFHLDENFHIAPESLHIYEAKEGDLINSKIGSEIVKAVTKEQAANKYEFHSYCHEMKAEEGDSFICFQGAFQDTDYYNLKDLKDVQIIQRQNKPFIDAETL